MRGPMMLRRLVMPLVAGLIAVWGARQAKGTADPAAQRQIRETARRARQGLRITRWFGRF
jgi:hypothetical protein